MIPTKSKGSRQSMPSPSTPGNPPTAGTSEYWLSEMARHQAPMGPRPSPGGSRTPVLARGTGSLLFDVEGRCYVDLAAGFGSLLLGHGHERILEALRAQGGCLLQALGDLYPSTCKVELISRLAALHPEPNAQVILGQSGADAITAALKTALLATEKPGLLSFDGAYHGLSYGPLAACGLRESYRAPFQEQLNPHVRSVPFPTTPAEASRVLEQLASLLKTFPIGALLLEPIQGRGGVLTPPPKFLSSLQSLCRDYGTLVIADEIWTGLGRAGALLASTLYQLEPDIICLGKGLGGGLPISACIGRRDIMHCWRKEEEVVHTSTFAGAPLACATALATLDAIEQEQLIERSSSLGQTWKQALEEHLSPWAPRVRVRGQGLMLGIEFSTEAGTAIKLQARLLESGFLISTGGGRRHTQVLTPALNIPEHHLEAFTATLADHVADCLSH